MRQAIFGCCVKCGHFISYTHLQSVILLVAWLIAGLYAASAASSVSEFFLFVFFVFFANQSSLLIVLLNLGLCCRRTVTCVFLSFPPSPYPPFFTISTSLTLAPSTVFRSRAPFSEPRQHSSSSRCLRLSLHTATRIAPDYPTDTTDSTDGSLCRVFRSSARMIPHWLSCP